MLFIELNKTEEGLFRFLRLYYNSISVLFCFSLINLKVEKVIVVKVIFDIISFKVIKIIQGNHYITAVDLVVETEVIRAKASVKVIVIVRNKLLELVVLSVIDYLINVINMIESSLFSDFFAYFTCFSHITKHLFSSEVINSRTY